MGVQKNATYKVDNGTDFDEINFKTIARQVKFPDGTSLLDFITKGGNISGTVNAINLQVGGKNVYHSGRKPTPADIGASPTNHTHLNLWTRNTSGGFDKTVTGFQRPNSNGIPYGLTMHITHPESSAGEYSRGLGFAYGDSLDLYTYAYSPDANKRSEARLYTTAYKPTPEDIGASASNHNHNDKASLNADVSFNLVASNRIKGKNNANRTYIGDGSCRVDTTGGVCRIFTSAEGAADYGMYMLADGTMHVRVKGSTTHAFYANGTKHGGSMEIDGTIYGMSPVDSHQTLIEYIEYDVNVDGRTEIMLDKIYSKMISKYAVFSSNPDIRILSKEKECFIVEGTGTSDFIIKGQRNGADEYFRIMGGVEHGVKEEQTI